MVVAGGEEEEWGSEEGVGPKTAPAPATAASSPKPAPSTPPPQPPTAASPAAAPKLRLNPSLATDPALRVPSPADLEYLASLPSALQTGQ